MIAVELTVFVKAGGPLTKRISLDAAGNVVSDGSACVMGRGTARRARIDTLHDLAELLACMEPREAIALGALRPDLPRAVTITTKRRLVEEINGAARPDLIARTGGYIIFQADRPGLALLDFDTKGMPAAVARKLDELGGFWNALISIVPAFKSTAHVLRCSTSAGLYRTDTGKRLPGSNGVHTYLLIKDGSDSERFLKTLHARCWLAGLGWMMVGAGGQLLERSIVDPMVGAPERLVFEGPPVLEPPLAQDVESRRPIATEGEILDTIAACPPLTILEQSRLRELIAKEQHRLAPDSAKAREDFVARQAQRLAARTGINPRRAARVVERQCAGVLLSDLDLPFDDPALAGATVADVLADPARFDGETLADPLEGPEYGTSKAKVMRRPDGSPWINSFAHGRTVYELRYSFAAAKAALEKVPEDEAARFFVKLALAADIEDDERETLRDLAARRAGVGKRTLDQKLKAAKRELQQRRAKEERVQQTAKRNDPRPQIPVPSPDAPWLPQMRVLGEVLGASRDAEPPARNVDGVYVKLRVRRASNMHAFTSRGSNAEETASTRLPAPEQPLLTRLTEAQLAEEIERHIDYVDKTGRSVHLPNAFVHHFHSRPDDTALPLAAAIATMPIVLGNGTLLASRGLDRERGIIFRIPEELLAILPQPADCTASAVAEAMRFLADEWLCDVATDYGGKCTFIAAALTVIERSLLPDRPTFWVTAGNPRSGKTTTLHMVLMAVTGVRPSAAAWSTNEEERRKALLAYLLEGLPALVWDNIPRGCQIGCPHIEKSCTTELYSDRRLGVSETIAVSAAVIHFFTGNNIGPRGDLASRSLSARLKVDRVDPENRPFRHPDPVDWTKEHRGQILQALYTILLGNPRLLAANPPPAETRFKLWFHLVGAAIEHAAQQHSEHVAAFTMDSHATCPPTRIRFKDLFLRQDEADEEAAELFDALAALAAKWPAAEQFLADDMAKLVNMTGVWAPPVDRALATTVRDFFFPQIPPNQAVSARAAGRRLKSYVGKPVQRADKTLILKTYEDTHAKIMRYYVEVR
jgi:hypothetical protein